MNIFKLLFLVISIIVSYTLNAQVAITTDGADPDGSAMLEVKSTDKGFLPPRMTQTQIEAITTPANGLIVFNTTDDKLYIFVETDNQWKEVEYGVGTITPPAIAIGDYYQGGVIFYLDGSGGGLICAITDQDGGSGITWYNGSYTTTGATATAIGTGQANTTAIFASQGEGSYAATVCTALGTGWFLPSKDELNEMYQNKTAIDATATANGGTAFVGTSYWSSSENINISAWTLNFSKGSQDYANKSFSKRVRPVRAF